MVWSMMAQANLSISFQGDALLTIAYILNQVLSKSVPSIPYELWNDEKLDLGNLHPQGCEAYFHNNSHQYGKLGLRGKKCILIRYSELSKGFVFFGEEADGRVIEIESRDVVFLEDDYPTRGEIEKNFQFYEMEDPDNGVPSDSIKRLEETLNLSKNNGSDFVLDPTPME